jgi:hypothetical protein
MEKMSFLASQNSNQMIEVSFCTELPEAIHMVKIYHDEGIELFFDGAVNWTEALEEAAESLLLGNLIYA